MGDNGQQQTPDWSKAAWVDPSHNWKPKPVPDMPLRLLMDLATKCNLRCPMCPVWGSEDNDKIDSVKGVMDFDRARKILDEVQNAKPMIAPIVYGEPLMVPKIKEHIQEMKSRGMAVVINTNGLTLSDDIAKYFVEQRVDSVMFSLDSVTPETLKKIRGVDRLGRIESSVFKMLRARGNAEYPRIGVSFTIQDDNKHELEAFVKRWVGVVDVVRTCPVFENGTFQGVAEPPVRTPCEAIYSTMPIHNDGSVPVCCLDGFRTMNMGNVFKDGVKAVWHGEEFAKVRYYHETNQYDKVPFCKPCNGWAQHGYQEEIRDGLMIRRSPQFTYYNKIASLKNWQGNMLGGHKPPPPELVANGL
jgi:sulfatase maturation enzyme AslB (radical SAM superfamily)